MEFMKDKPDNFYDLAVVDPPYGLDKSSLNGSGKLKNRVLNKMDTNWDESPEQSYFDELFRVSENQIIWGGNYFNLPVSRGFIIWDKKQFMPTFSRCEYAWISMYKPSKIFAYNNASKTKIHPTQKPIALYKWLLTNYAKPGFKLLDTHSGSGSFRIAAYDLGFDLDSCELDADYCQSNEARYQNHIQQGDLFKPEEIQKNIYTQGEL